MVQIHALSCFPNILLWSLQARSRSHCHSSASYVFVPLSVPNSFKLTWPRLPFVGNEDAVHDFVRAEVCSRVFRQGHFPPYGCGLCSRLPHQKGMSPCRGRNSSALKEYPRHLWILALQKCTEEKHRRKKPRLVLPSFAKEGQWLFWIKRER